jgi:hypothetical protein
VEVDRSLYSPAAPGAGGTTRTGSRGFPVPPSPCGRRRLPLAQQVEADVGPAGIGRLQLAVEISGRPLVGGGAAEVVASSISNAAALPRKRQAPAIAAPALRRAAVCPETKLRLLDPAPPSSDPSSGGYDGTGADAVVSPHSPHLLGRQSSSSPARQKPLTPRGPGGWTCRRGVVLRAPAGASGAAGGAGAGAVRQALARGAMGRLASPVMAHKKA